MGALPLWATVPRGTGSAGPDHHTRVRSTWKYGRPCREDLRFGRVRSMANCDNVRVLVRTLLHRTSYACVLYVLASLVSFAHFWLQVSNTSSLPLHENVDPDAQSQPADQTETRRIPSTVHGLRAQPAQSAGRWLSIISLRVLAIPVPRNPCRLPHKNRNLRLTLFRWFQIPARDTATKR